MNTGLLFVVSAPSGTGKSTLLKEVMNKTSNLVFSISHTTRKPRPGEVNGVQYHFTDPGRFKQMIAEEAFLEWAKVYENLYGTSIHSVKEQLDNGSDVLLEIDVQGADNVRRNTDYPNISIFIAPPSLAEMEKRLRSRGTENEKDLALRLREAQQEMQKAPAYDYLIINDTLDEAVDMFCAIILAERARARRNRFGKAIRLDI